MYRKDQVKGIIAIILFGIIGVSFFVFGDESPLTKYIALGAFVIWLIATYFIRKNFEKND